MSQQSKRLVIIDGKSVFYRGYYAMPNLSTKDGTPTGGVYGFAVLSLEVIKRLKPDYVCVAWDKPKTNIRKRLEMYPEYKAGRKPAPPDFYVQIPLLHEYLQACSWPLYELDDYEADDIMCTLAKKAEAKGIETVLITSDLDVLQCVSPLTHVYLLKKGLSNIEQLNPDSFEQKYNIPVEHFVDLKALKGDSSDNIPGVPGIGEKTAIDLLKQYDTLEGVYQHLDDIKPTLRAKLETGRDMAVLSKQLVTLFDHAPLDLDLNEMDITKLDAHKLQELIKKFEFRSLLRQLPESMQVSSSDNQSLFEQEKSEIRGHGIDPIKLTEAKSADDIFGQLAGKNYFVYPKYANKDHSAVSWLALADDQGRALFVDGELAGRKDFKAQFMQDMTATVVTHDIKSLLKLHRAFGHDAQPINLYDVQIAAFLLNGILRDTSFSGLARDLLDLEIEAGDLTPLEEASIGLAVLKKLHEVLDREMSKPDNTKLLKLFNDIEMPVTRVIAEMEARGILLDGDYLRKMSAELADKVSDIEQTIYGHAGQEFNISSPLQLGKVLFDDLSLPTMGVKKGKTGYSTAADVLDKLREFHPIIDCITQYREYTKLKSTYLDTLPDMVDGQGRLHTTFNMTIAATGRLSSNDPNLQNIPVRTELGKKIRKAFVADKGKVLVSADYSQFELRLAAVMSADHDMVEAFNSGIDIHTMTASQVFGVALEDVTKDMRYAAKAVNFGILYGQTPHGLAAGTGMSFVEAKDFIDKYFEKREPLRAYIKALRNQAYEQGYVETLFGRRRPTPDVKSSNFIVREAAYRQAINMPIQGTEADLMKLAMLKLDAELPGSAEQLLQIHDSILVECPTADAEKVGQIMKQVMENIYPELGVKLDVDVSSGPTWGDL